MGNWAVWGRRVMIDPQLKEMLNQSGYFQLREIPGHGLCGVCRFIFTVAIVCGINSVGYRYRYCYPDALSANMAYDEWDGEGHPPGNWIKRKGEGGDLANPNMDDAEISRKAVR